MELYDDITVVRAELSSTSSKNDEDTQPDELYDDIRSPQPVLSPSHEKKTEFQIPKSGEKAGSILLNVFRTTESPALHRLPGNWVPKNRQARESQCDPPSYRRLIRIKQEVRFALHCGIVRRKFQTN